MPDCLFADAKLAPLYDLLAPWGAPDDLFYFPLVMAAGSVLDVGCGTGLLLRTARESGHEGWLCGLDPAAAMLDVARARTDIEWVVGDLATAGFDRAFELVVMTGHAFQVFLTEAEVREALTAVGAALVPGGRFAFETRNPLARAWEGWTPEHVIELTTPAGEVVRMTRAVETPVTGEFVRFTHTFTSPAWQHPESSRSTLRFLDREELARFLAEAGLTIEEQYGNWDRTPFIETSPEIITIARRP